MNEEYHERKRGQHVAGDPTQASLTQLLDAPFRSRFERAALCRRRRHYIWDLPIPSPIPLFGEDWRPTTTCVLFWRSYRDAFRVHESRFNMSGKRLRISSNARCHSKVNKQHSINLRFGSQHVTFGKVPWHAGGVASPQLYKLYNSYKY